MANRKIHPLFDSYCYGPADLLELQKGDSTMWLTLRDSAGKRTEAVYCGCVYWRLDQTGIRLSLVQRVTAQELLERHQAITVRELRKNATDVAGLLQEWEDAGLSFFLHLGSRPGMEYLVVARSLEYRDVN